MTASLIPKIMVGCKQLGLDDDTRKALQLQVVGKDSLKDMTEAERQSVLDELKKRGFKASSKRGKHRRAPRADIRLIHVLWAALGNARKLNDPTRKGLNAFIQKRFGKAWGFVPVDVDQLGENKQINDVLKALKEWVRRDVPDFDWDRIGQ